MAELTAAMRDALRSAELPSAADLCDPRLTFTTLRPSNPSQGASLQAHLGDDCPLGYDPPGDQNEPHAVWRLCQFCACELNRSFTDMCRIATGLPLIAALAQVPNELGLGTFASVNRAKNWIAGAMLAAGVLRAQTLTGILDRPLDNRNSAWVADTSSTTAAAIQGARAAFADAYERRFAVRAQEPRIRRAMFVPRATFALLSENDSPGNELVAYEWLASSPEEGWAVVGVPERPRQQRTRSKGHWSATTDLGPADSDTADTWLAFTAIYNNGAVTANDAISAARGVGRPIALAAR